MKEAEISMMGNPAGPRKSKLRDPEMDMVGMIKQESMEMMD